MAVGEADRIRSHTPEAINAEIDHCVAARIEDFATRSSAEIDAQIARLDRTWGLDRVAVTFLSGVALVCSAAAYRLGPAWLLGTGVATLSLLRYAVSGSGPGLVRLRRMGLRTRREIECERCALKALRGDFELVTSARSPIAQAGNALQAALR
ncbi:MAG: hypothetical protein HY901_35280 [Deltaproteobacteria bacterium]|nr:hypothetical protein [Deltaproteobacteria bacterium]